MNSITKGVLLSLAFALVAAGSATAQAVTKGQEQASPGPPAESGLLQQCLTALKGPTAGVFDIPALQKPSEDAKRLVRYTPNFDKRDLRLRILLVRPGADLLRNPTDAKQFAAQVFEQGEVMERDVVIVACPGGLFLRAETIPRRTITTLEANATERREQISPAAFPGGEDVQACVESVLTYYRSVGTSQAMNRFFIVMTWVGALVVVIAVWRFLAVGRREQRLRARQLLVLSRSLADDVGELLTRASKEGIAEQAVAPFRERHLEAAKLLAAAEGRQGKRELESLHAAYASLIATKGRLQEMLGISPLPTAPPGQPPKS